MLAHVPIFICNTLFMLGVRSRTWMVRISEAGRKLTAGKPHEQDFTSMDRFYNRLTYERRGVDQNGPDHSWYIQFIRRPHN